MSRTGKFLLLVALVGLFVLGVPATAATVWQDMVVEYSLVAVLLVLAYEGGLAVVAGVAAGPLKHRLTQASTAVDRAVGRWLSRYGRQYRDHVRTWQRFIDARGLATVGAHTPELDQVFVDVGLAPRPPHQVPAGVLADAPPDVAARHSIHEFLHQPEPAVLAVLGAPGSGKTTLLRHVAYQAVRPGRRVGRPVPVLLALRDHLDRIAAAPTTPLPEVVRAGLTELPVREPDGWWEGQLHHGRCVVLLDGLDEVAWTPDRRAVSDWIEQQIMWYPKNDFVVTSRPHGYRNAVIAPATVLQVRPFTDDQVRRFLHRWYLATERHATGTDGPDVVARAQERAADLLGRLTAAPGPQELAVNPLLLTMIALVHRYRSALPAGRADLYGEICQVMLWRRQEAKRLPVDLPGSGKERVLAHLAFTMMQRRVRDLSRREVLDTLRPRLRRISTSTSPEAFLADVESNGLLVERERDRYAFAHHTIGEYLAARHIRDHGLSQELADAVGDPWWRETTLLYVADADADPVVRACLDDGSVPALALAFDCVRGGGALAPELRVRLDQIRDEAFRPGADPERRRLVASVVASRQLGTLVSVGGDARICPHPIPTDLYWLFCQDTGHPYPDGRAELVPEADRPVRGVWYPDAVAFTSWVNTVMSALGGRGALFRLPAPREVQQLAAQTHGTVTDRFRPERTGVWTRPEAGSAGPSLWLHPSIGDDPHVVSAGHIVEATTLDTVRSPVLLELLLVSASALDRAIDLGLGEPGRPRALPAAIARDLEVAHTLTHYHDFHLGPEHALAVADALGFAGTFDLVRARDLARLDRAVEPDGDDTLAPSADHLPGGARIPGPNVARALAQALGLTFAPTPAAADAADLTDRLTNDRAGADRAGTVERVRGAVMGVGLARALAAVHEWQQPKHRRTSIQPLAETFAVTLARRAAILAGYQETVPLERLGDLLETGCAAFISDRRGPGAAWSATVARRLAATAAPVFGRRRPLASLEPVVIRLPALALAAQAEHRNRPAAAAALRTVAAGVTLLQRRAAGEQVLETVLLARA